MKTAAIEVVALRKMYAGREVLADVTMTVPKGETYALLGRNGQGKSTTIRTMLGLVSRDSGQVRVDGLDPQKDSLKIRERVGYLAEDQQMYGWMTVTEIQKFLKPFYPTWDDELARKLQKDFELSAGTQIEHLSKGQNVRLGLLLALAHRPDIVILDDPALGLDPIMRKEFMRDVIEHLQGNGVTVFFSSHLLYEIEMVADRVAILDGGRIIRESPTEALRSGVRLFTLPAEAQAIAADLPAILDRKLSGRQCAVVTEDPEAVRNALTQSSATFEETELNLDEIFEAYVIGNRGRNVK